VKRKMLRSLDCFSIWQFVGVLEEDEVEGLMGFTGSVLPIMRGR